MKLLRKASHIVVSLAAGGIGGIFLAYCTGIATDRARMGSTFGGEVLLLPLMAMLVLVGYWIGKMWAEILLEKARERAFRSGWRVGCEFGRCQRKTKPQQARPVDIHTPEQSEVIQ